jgi:gamma-aminobutyric acid type B receptor
LEAVRPAGIGKCAVEKLVTTDDGAVVMAVSGVLAALTLALAIAIFAYRDRYVMKAASPLFCQMMCVGALIGYLWIFTFVGRPTVATCHMRHWLGGLAFVLLFGPLFAKTYRIHRVFNNKKLRKVAITNKTLFSVICITLFIQCIILALYSLVGQPFVELTPDELQPLVTYVGCGADNFTTWVVIDLGFKGLMVLYGIFLSFATRNVKSEFNESKQITVAIYNLGFMGAIIIPLVYGLDLSYDATFVLIVIGVFATVTVTLLVLFVPKFLNINKTKSDIEAEQNTTTSGGTTSLSSAGDRKVLEGEIAALKMQVANMKAAAAAGGQGA